MLPLCMQPQKFLFLSYWLLGNCNLIIFFSVECVGPIRIGCSNPVADSFLRRSGPTLPYLQLCKLHIERLNSHKSCAQCGEFCAQVGCWIAVETSFKNSFIFYNYILSCNFKLRLTSNSKSSKSWSKHFLATPLKA